MTISQQASDVRGRPLEARAGDIVNNSHHVRRLSLINSQSQAKQVMTCTVSGATNDKVYSVVVNGFTVSYTADSSATIAEIAAGLAAAVNAEALVGGQVIATSTATECILTSRWPGESFTFTEADAQLSIATTTANAEASTVAFGVGVVSTVFAAGEDAQPGAQALDSLYTAQVMQLDYTYNAGDVVHISILDKHSGAVIAETSYTLATDKPTSTAAIVAILNAQLPANSVLAADAGAGDEINLTAEIAGFEFDAAIKADDNGTTAVIKTLTTGPSPATSLLRSLVGVSERRDDVETETVGGTAVAYKANSGCIAVYDEPIWVATDASETVAFGQSVYIELDGSASLNGHFYNTDSSTRLLVPGWSWIRAGRTSTDNIGALQMSQAGLKAAANAVASV